MRRIQNIARKALVVLHLLPRPDFEVTFLTEHPDKEKLTPGVIYVVGGRGYQKWAYFLCPSRNGDVIQLSLQQARRPRWRVSEDFFGRPSIHPSVRQLAGSYAHFWISNGAVHWCGDTGKPPARHAVADEEILA